MPDLEDVRWASEDITLPEAGVSNKIDPSDAIKDNGYDKGQKPTASNFNFWRNAVYEWIEDLDGRTTAALAIGTVYPVGSVYVNVSDDTNPGTLFGVGTWVRIGQGRVLIGEGEGTDENGDDVTFDIGDTGGEYEHTLTVPELPSHNHTVRRDEIGSGDGYSLTRTGNTDESLVSDEIGFTGSSQSHNNIQPYLTVYMWSRTA